ncbi:MAG: hypothetical protein AB1476_05640 [Candidatus Hadarchaeota archaeon]
MGAVLRPEDLLKGRRRALERAAGDLAPGQLERVRELLQRFDERSRGELVDLLGKERTNRLLKELGAR